jgi:hypothetical protein
MFTMFALTRARCGSQACPLRLVNSKQCGLAMPLDMHAAKQSDSYYASVMFLPEIQTIVFGPDPPPRPLSRHG